MTSTTGNRSDRVFTANRGVEHDTNNEAGTRVPYTPTPTAAFLLQQRSESRRLLNGSGIPRMASFERDPPIKKSITGIRKLSEYEKNVLEQGTSLPWEAKTEPLLPQTTFGENVPIRPRKRSATIQSSSNGEGSRDLALSFSLPLISPEGDVEASFAVLESPRRSGAHRDGYSDAKCRYVLVTECASIARQYNYAEGIKRLYPVLREYLGDENLDLATGVLYEMIEIPVDYQWEEGGIFQRWNFDHLRRDNFENAHAPALGNIIVGPVVPTEPLRQYRTNCQHRSAPPTPLCSQSQVVTNQKYNSYPGAAMPVSTHIRSQKEWQIDYSSFVSSNTLGTKVYQKPPTPADLHLKIWDASFGRGGRLVNQRHYEPSGPVPEYHSYNESIPEEIPSQADTTMSQISNVFCSSILSSFFNTLSKNQDSMKGEDLRMDRLDRKPILPKTICLCDTSGHSSCSVQIYELNRAVKLLPDPSTQEGKQYYSSIQNQALPDGFTVPTESFARRNELIPKGATSPAAAVSRTRLPSIEELALKRAHRAFLATPDVSRDFNGPFTNTLFKDGGMDFQWRKAKVKSPKPLPVYSMTHECRIVRPQTPMDFSRLGDGAGDFDDVSLTSSYGRRPEQHPEDKANPPEDAHNSSQEIFKPTLGNSDVSSEKFVARVFFEEKLKELKEVMVNLIEKSWRNKSPTKHRSCGMLGASTALSKAINAIGRYKNDVPRGTSSSHCSMDVDKNLVTPGVPGQHQHKILANISAITRHALVDGINARSFVVPQSESGQSFAAAYKEPAGTTAGMAVDGNIPSSIRLPEAALGAAIEHTSQEAEHPFAAQTAVSIEVEPVTAMEQAFRAVEHSEVEIMATLTTKRDAAISKIVHRRPLLDGNTSPVRPRSPLQQLPSSRVALKRKRTTSEVSQVNVEEFVAVESNDRRSSVGFQGGTRLVLRDDCGQHAAAIDSINHDVICDEWLEAIAQVSQLDPYIRRRARYKRRDETTPCGTHSHPHMSFDNRNTNRFGAASFYYDGSQYPWGVPAPPPLPYQSAVEAVQFDPRGQFQYYSELPVVAYDISFKNKRCVFDWCKQVADDLAFASEEVRVGREDLEMAPVENRLGRTTSSAISVPVFPVGNGSSNQPAQNGDNSENSSDVLYMRGGWNEKVECPSEDDDDDADDERKLDAGGSRPDIETRFSHTSFHWTFSADEASFMRSPYPLDACTSGGNTDHRLQRIRQVVLDRASGLNIQLTSDILDVARQSKDESADGTDAAWMAACFQYPPASKTDTIEEHQSLFVGATVNVAPVLMSNDKTATGSHVSIRGFLHNHRASYPKRLQRSHSIPHLSPPSTTSISQRIVISSISRHLERTRKFPGAMSGLERSSLFDSISTLDLYDPNFAIDHPVEWRQWQEKLREEEEHDDHARAIEREHEVSLQSPGGREENDVSVAKGERSGISPKTPPYPLRMSSLILNSTQGMSISPRRSASYQPQTSPLDKFVCPGGRRDHHRTDASASAFHHSVNNSTDLKTQDDSQKKVNDHYRSLTQSNAASNIATSIHQRDISSQSRKKTHRFSIENQKKLVSPDAKYGVKVSILNKLVEPTPYLDQNQQFGDATVLHSSFTEEGQPVGNFDDATSRTAENDQSAASYAASDLATVDSMPLCSAHQKTPGANAHARDARVDLANRNLANVPDHLVQSSPTSVYSLLKTPGTTTQQVCSHPKEDWERFPLRSSSRSGHALLLSPTRRIYVKTKKFLVGKLVSRLQGVTSPHLSNVWKFKGDPVDQSAEFAPFMLRIPVSMNADLQQQFYSFLEYALHNTAGLFLALEYRGRRMNIRTASDIEKAWKREGNEPVGHFRFDLTFQIRLVKMNMENFNFGGGFSFNQVGLIIEELMEMAVQLRSRTYSSSDDTIRNQLRVTNNAFQILNANPDVLVKFDDYRLQFEQAIVDRTESDQGRLGIKHDARAHYTKNDGNVRADFGVAADGDRPTRSFLFDDQGRDGELLDFGDDPRNGIRVRQAMNQPSHTPKTPVSASAGQGDSRISAGFARFIGASSTRDSGRDDSGAGGLMRAFSTRRF